MNYINKGKRDILIFPQFDNIDKIQNIRNRYDELSQILPPHITLVFPFKIDLKNDEIRKKLSDICKSYNRFNIKCKGISFLKDKRINKYYIFLNIVEVNKGMFRLNPAYLFRLFFIWLPKFEPALPFTV